MGGFEKSAKTTHTPPRVPFQTKTRAQAAAEVSAAETAAANTTDTDWRHALGGARLGTDACMMTDDSSTLTSPDGRCTPAYSSSWNTLGALKLNQMSTTLHSNTQTTPTTSVVYTSNKNTQRIRLDENLFRNTRALVENLVTPIDLRLGYNVKSDIYDNQLLCLIVRLFCLSI